MKIGLLGAGTIGGGVDIILESSKDMEVTRVLSLVVDDRIRDRIAASVDEIVNDPEIDTVVEVMGGVHPAYEFVSACMKAGKNAVTANKALVAAYYKELIELAEEHHVSFRCTAAVGGGIPWLVNLERVKRMDRISAVHGIMNGTTNFMMNKMTAEGADFDAVLSEAQALGYAEKNPSADIDGLDVRRKLNISANIAWDKLMDEEEIPTLGIRHVTAEDVAEAKKRGSVIKLLAYAGQTENGIYAYVEPSLIPAGAVEASIPLNYNIVSYEADRSGLQSFIGEGAGRFPTASNVVQDLIDISERHPGFYTETLDVCSPDNSGVRHAYYVRTDAPDDYLLSIAETKEGSVYVTKPVPVSVMHAWAKEKLSQAPVFIAGIR